MKCLALFLCLCLLVSPTVAGTIWITPAITDNQILPTTLPPDNKSKTINVKACKGEVLSLSFCVRTSKPELVIVSTSVPWMEVRHVKCWWQNTMFKYGEKKIGLVPELLLNDLDFVTVNNETKTNTVREPISDADNLQPASLPKNWTQQYWVTIRVPDRESDTVLRRRIRIDQVSNKVSTSYISVHIQVLPFDLEKPKQEIAVYYRGFLEWRASQPTVVGSENKNHEQFVADLKNMKDHGINNLLTYQPEWCPAETLKEVVSLRKETGIAVEPWYWTTQGVGWGPDEEIDYLKTQVRLLKDAVTLASVGVNDIYGYGKDEATSGAISEQFPRWKNANSVGYKVFIAMYDPLVPALVKDKVNMALFHDPASISVWHGYGVKSWYYGPTTYEQSERIRKEYGFRIIREGWDGISPYAYQHVMGNSVWDDMDHGYKDHAFTYPTLNTPVDTVQWEGFREAINDLRYAATLEKLGGTIPDDQDRDPDEVREEIINSILEIMKGNH